MCALTKVITGVFRLGEGPLNSRHLVRTLVGCLIPNDLNLLLSLWVSVWQWVNCYLPISIHITAPTARILVTSLHRMYIDHIAMNERRT